MIDFNAVITAAITTSITNAVETATAPLKAQIEKLEERLSATQAILPVKFAAIAETTSRLENNLTATNSRIPQPQDRVISAAAIAVALDDQEWFWNKINNYVDQHMEARHPQPQQDNLSPEQRQQVRDIATELILNIDYTDAIGDAFANSSIVEDAVEHYIKDYDFSEIVADNVEGVVENQLSSYDFREIVGDILEDARITL